MPVRDTYSFDTTVLPGQNVNLKSTERVLLADSTTAIQVDLPVTNNDVARYRYTGTGTAPAFRQNRILGIDSTTQIAITLSGNSAAVFSCPTGTPMVFANIQVGDSVYLQPTDNNFTTPFNINNTSTYPGVLYTVIDRNFTSFTVRNPGNLVPETVTLGTTFTDAIRVFGGVGVQVADSVVFDSNCNLNIQNKTGQFDVALVTDRDLFIINPSAVPSLTGVALGGLITNSPIRVFSDIISFIAIDADGEMTLRFNNNSLGDITMYCYALNKSFFAGSVNATSITAINNTSNPITIRINTASF